MNPIYAETATALWFVWGVSWLAAALWTARTLRSAVKSSYRRQLAVACVGFGCLFAEAPWRVHPLWSIGPVTGWAMVALVGFGLAFGWWARLHLGALWSGGIVRREDHRIVDTGPYALVRHPIYTAIIAGAIGLALLKATILALAGALLIAIGFALKARVEERFLGSELGERAYARYRARVPMLVPFAPTHG